MPSAQHDINHAVSDAIGMHLNTPLEAATEMENKTRCRTCIQQAKYEDDMKKAATVVEETEDLIAKIKQDIQDVQAFLTMEP